MRRTDSISARQLAALGFVFILSSLIRNVPGRTASAAGVGAWASVLPAAAVLGLLPVFYRWALRKSEGRSLGLVLLDCAGPVLGRAVLAALLGWFVFAAGFLLRSGADRFVSTIYPASRPGVFICVTLLLCVPAALGPVKAVARAAVLFRPLLIAVVLLAVLSVTADADLHDAVLVTQANLAPAMKAALPLIDTISAVAPLAFLEGKVDGPRAAGGCACCWRWWAHCARRRAPRLARPSPDRRIIRFS